ncbi:MAG: cytochrome ubiquinol oxidase subunit I, partial [Polyangiales bacterium]
MDTLTAARAQMELSLAFHMIFAAMGIGMPLVLVIAEALHLRTGDAHWREIARRQAKATAILFAVGAVSGTALSFELGLLWPRFMRLAGPVLGPAFALEGYAFFIEAIFIGLYLYGWNRLTPRQHFLVGIPVAVSGALSGILVVAANAWMQCPPSDGARLVEGVLVDI